jgi:hypothetical protein
MPNAPWKVLSDYSLDKLNLAELEHIRASLADCRVHFEGHGQDVDAEIAVIEAEIKRRKGRDDAE